MQQQIAACFALIVEDAETGVGVGGKYELPDEVQPSMIEKVPHGTKVTTVTPPKGDNSSSTDTALKRDMAMGLGLSAEMFSGDYSQLNFASGRMAKQDFFSELDHVQYHVLLPALNKISRWFISIYEIRKGKAKIKTEWTFPPRSAVNPKEEFEAV